MPSAARRGGAPIEVLLCSDFPTQIAISGTLQVLGYGPPVNGPLSIGYVVALSLATRRCWSR